MIHIENVDFNAENGERACERGKKGRDDKTSSPQKIIIACFRLPRTFSISSSCHFYPLYIENHSIEAMGELASGTHNAFNEQTLQQTTNKRKSV